MSNYPWYKYYGSCPHTLDYPGYSMFRQVEKAAEKHPSLTALDFMGKKTPYSDFIRDVHTAAKALCALGIKDGERVTVCMPNAPQAIVMFYAVNLCGGVANMIHPLSSEGEIEFYIRDSGSKTLLTLDQFYPKLAKVREKIEIKNLIIV